MKRFIIAGPRAKLSGLKRTVMAASLQPGTQVATTENLLGSIA
jgi:hypothetical protein